MIQFQVDGRDNFSQSPSDCNTCCCQTASAIPGEANKWRLNYMQWLAGISGRGLVAPVDFSFQKLTPNPTAPFPTLLPPTNIDYTAQIEANTPYNGTVATSAVSPQSSPLTFALDPTNPPTNGIVAMNTNGTYIYVPTAGFTGVDNFAFTTTDGVNTPIKNIVTIGVDTLVATNFATPLPAGVIALTGGIQVYETPLPPNQGLIYVDPKSVMIRNPMIDFKLTVSPETLIGQVYRLTVAAVAMDCDVGIFRHISCYDITITTCGF